MARFVISLRSKQVGDARYGFKLALQTYQIHLICDKPINVTADYVTQTNRALLNRSFRILVIHLRLTEFCIWINEFLLYKSK